MNDNLYPLWTKRSLPNVTLWVLLQILLAEKGIDKFIQQSQQIIIQRDLETLYSCMILINKPTIRCNKLIASVKFNEIFKLDHYLSESATFNK